MFICAHLWLTPRRCSLVLICGFAFALAPGWARQGDRGRICYVRQDGQDYNLHVMDAAGKNDRLLPNQPGKVNAMPAWSPNGQLIAFISGPTVQGPEFGLYVMEDDGKNVRRLAAKESMVSSPAWSPDNQRLLFLSTRGTTRYLLSVQVADDEVEEVPLEIRPLMAPFFAPDGRQIAVTASSNERDRVSWQMYTTTMLGAPPVKQTSGPGPCYGGPAGWSPDGKTMVFVSLDAPPKVPHLHLWNLDAKEEKHLIDLKLPPDVPAEWSRAGWAPDGKSVVVSHLGTAAKSALWSVTLDGTPRRLSAPDAPASFMPVVSRN